MTGSIDRVGYRTARAFERALTDRIATAAASSPYGVPELRRQFAYGRLLDRVFFHDPDRWVLKGATGLLARMPGQARHSMDIDLFFDGQIEAAIDALRDAVRADRGDFFTFDIERGTVLSGATVGSTLRCIAYLGDKVFEAFRVDVIVTHTMTAEPELVSPIVVVEVSGLRSVGYVTYPIADQIADKVAALVETHADRPSTRYRDLVDLVLIATTQIVEACSLHRALFSELKRRGLEPEVPPELPSAQWRQGYRNIAADLSGFGPVDADEAIAIVRQFVEPVLKGLSVGAWDPDGLEWGSP